MRTQSTTSSASGLFHLTDYLRVLYRRRWTAGLALVVVFVVGAFNTLKKTAIYETSAQVLIEKEARRATSLNTVLETPESYYDDDFYQTQYRVMQSRALAWRAIEALHLTPSAPVAAPAQPPASSGFSFDGITAWVSNLIGAPKKIDPPAADETTAQSQAIGGFLGGLQIVPVRNTHLVDVRYRHPDPLFAMRAANAIADEYIKQSQQLRFLATKEATDFLDQQLEEQKKKVTASEEALQRYKESHDAVALDDLQKTVVAQMAEIGAQVNRATLDRIEKENVYNTLQRLQDGDRSKLETYPAIMSNTEIQKLNAEIRDVNQKRMEASVTLGPKMLSHFDEQLQQLAVKRQGFIDQIVESARNEYLTAKSKEQQYLNQQESQNRQALSLNRKGVDYATLLREAQSNRLLYDTLLQRTKETGVSSEFKGSNIQVIDRAEVPRSPVLPNTRRDLMIGFLTGLVLAVALAFAFEYVDNRIRTPDEIKTHLGIPFLGLVPKVDPKKGEGAILINNGVPPAFGEALRAIRTAVVFSSADEGGRSVVVTSAAPGEGKTLISSNLALALAQAGQRTLIIDGDMRRPRVHEVFGCEQEPGLSNVLVGAVQLRNAMRTTSVPQLCVLPAGHIPPNPAELLGSPKYRDLLAELGKQFDWIVIDAPPVMAVTDAAVISNRANGVMFVVGAEMTPRRTASAAIEQLTAAKAHFIGAVLNRVDIDRHAYYYTPYYRKDYTQGYHKAPQPHA